MLVLSFLALLLIPHTTASSDSRLCGPMAARRQCVLQSVPQFTDACTEWDGSPVVESQKPESAIDSLTTTEPRKALIVPQSYLRPGVLSSQFRTELRAARSFPWLTGFGCQLHPLTTREVLVLLNNSAVVFIGDSTARRASLELRSMLHERFFEDESTHENLAETISFPSHSFTTTVMSLWLRDARYFKHALKVSANSTLANAEASSIFHVTDFATHKNFSVFHTRKVVVVQMSTWDLMNDFLHPNASNPHFQAHVKEWTGNMSGLLTEMKTTPGFDPRRDILLLRLPIAQGCINSIQSSKCVEERGFDPVNEQVEYAHSMLRERLLTDNPEVGLLDVFTWTFAGKTGTNRKSSGNISGPTVSGVGRDKCAMSDEGGTHFGTEGGRKAYVHQVLRAAGLLTCGNPNWDHWKGTPTLQ